MTILDLFISVLLFIALCWLVYYLCCPASYDGAYVDEHSKRPIVIVNGRGGMILSDGDTQLPHRRRLGRHYFGDYRVKRRDGLVCLMEGRNCVMALRRDERFRLK